MAPVIHTTTKHLSSRAHPSVHGGVPGKTRVQSRHPAKKSTQARRRDFFESRRQSGLPAQTQNPFAGLQAPKGGVSTSQSTKTPNPTPTPASSTTDASTAVVPPHDEKGAFGSQVLVGNDKTQLVMNMWALTSVPGRNLRVTVHGAVTGSNDVKREAAIHGRVDNMIALVMTAGEELNEERVKAGKPKVNFANFDKITFQAEQGDKPAFILVHVNGKTFQLGGKAPDGAVEGHLTKCKGVGDISKSLSVHLEELRKYLVGRDLPDYISVTRTAEEQQKNDNFGSTFTTSSEEAERK